MVFGFQVSRLSLFLLVFNEKCINSAGEVDQGWINCTQVNFYWLAYAKYRKGFVQSGQGIVKDEQSRAASASYSVLPLNPYTNTNKAIKGGAAANLLVLKVCSLLEVVLFFFKYDKTKNMKMCHRPCFKLKKKTKRKKQTCKINIQIHL